MKFKATPYHFDLLKDLDRLAAFYQAIKDNDTNTDLAFDLGCGSGVLSYFLSEYFKEITAVEVDRSAFKCAQENLKDFQNVCVVNSDVLQYDFDRKADLIVCEMMDTALIDEEEVPVLSHAKKYLKEDGKIIPQGVINSAELVFMEREYLHWDENAKYEVISRPVIYSQFDFLDDINPEFEAEIEFKAAKSARINGIKITTFTKLTENIIAGPTPMFNPPLMVPIKQTNVKANDLIIVKLKYIMGNGIESIKTDIL